MKRVVLYIRVSTDEQIKGFSIQEQKERLIAYCKAMGWVIVKIFIDPGKSGSNLKRPGMESLIEYSKEKKCDVVLVYKLDRLSRSQKDTLHLIEDIFLPNNVDFVSVQESFDTSTPFGKFMVGILSVFAQLERENIKSRTMMGRAGRAKEGFWHGGGTDPIGYDYIDGKLVINESEAEQVRMVYDLYAAGYTLSYIRDKMEGYATKHGDWHHIGTITSVLDNELYNGTVHFQNIRSPESHNAIIDSELFNMVRILRERNKKLKYGEKKSEHLLTGMLYCRQCGARYFAKKNPNGSYKYICHSRAKVNKKMVKDKDCKNHIWEKAELEQKFESILLYMAQHPEHIKGAAWSDSGPSDRGHMWYPEQITEIDQEIDKYMTLYANDKIPEEVISEKIDVLYRKRQALLSSGEIEAVGNEAAGVFAFEGAKLLLRDVAASWSEYNQQIKRQILMNLLNGIDIDGDELYVRWSFC